MVDAALVRRPALADAGATAAPGAPAAITVVPPRARFILRGRPGVADAAAGALGFPLPVAACRAVGAGDVAGLWLGPDEWLVIGPEAAHRALATELEAALSALPHAMVDVSHRNTAVTVQGPRAAFVLNHGCPLDLDPAAFPVGMCTRTLVGRTEVVLWRTGPQAFHLEVWRSFASYLLAFLAEACRERA